MPFNSQRLCTISIENYNLASCQSTIRMDVLIKTELTKPNCKKLTGYHAYSFTKYISETMFRRGKIWLNAALVLAL